MQLTSLFDTPYFTGTTSTTSLVPGVFPVALAGRPYALDTSPEAFAMRWRHESIPLMRAQADNAQTPAEQSLNPDGYWRRAQDSWHHGGGQNYRDRDELADPYRFRSSKGLDIWTRYQLSLLNEATQKLSSVNTNLRGVPAGTRYYVIDGSNLKYSADLSAWTTVTGYTGASILSLCSDGFTVYFTDGANVWTTNTGTSAATSVNTIDASVIAWVKSRLMIAGSGATKNSIYNITAIGTPPVALMTHFNTDFTWVGFAEGTANIYAAGYSGDKSTIYRIAVKQDASALDQPIVAGALPDGEVIACIEGYLGNIWIGSNRGWRFASVDGQGNLEIGPLQITPASVQCFEGQDRFMWFGYTAYDATSTGLGRSDPTTFVVMPNQLAFASDLMVTGSGAVLSVSTFNNLRVFTISGMGVYAEGANKVATAQMLTGLISYGLPDPKTVTFIDIRSTPLAGGYTVEIATDGGAYTILGSEATAGDNGSVFPAEAIGERFELRFTFTRSAGAITTGPTLLRWTLKAFPSPEDGQVEKIYLPLLLHHRLSDPYPPDYAVDVEFEFQLIDSLRSTRQIVTLQELHTSYVGIVDDFTWLPYGLRNSDTNEFTVDGTMTVVFKRIT